MARTTRNTANLKCSIFCVKRTLHWKDADEASLIKRLNSLLSQHKLEPRGSIQVKYNRIVKFYEKNENCLPTWNHLKLWDDEEEN
jgi:hypothetical protein